MTKALLHKLAFSGNYPFCECCGEEIEVEKWVHRRVTVFPGGNKHTKYFCMKCEKSGRMYGNG